MRTTLTLEADVAAKLKRVMKRKKVTMKDAINAALREGLDRELAEPAPEPFVLVPHDLGGFRPGIDITKLGQLDEELQTEDAVERMRRAQSPQRAR